ncbi:MAG: cytochrome c [Usitatibacter sp.]
MSTLDLTKMAALVLMLAGCATGAGAPEASQEKMRYGLGTPLTDRELAGWNIDVAIDGKGLPPGRGSVAEGKVVYAAKCAACHGAKGEGKPANRLVGGAVKPPAPVVKTVGSFWPHATTLYDYVYRAMPWDKPQSLSANEVYAVSAYVLHLNGIVPEGAVLDAKTLPQVRMPNRDGFTAPDPRPDTH